MRESYIVNAREILEALVISNEAGSGIHAHMIAIQQGYLPADTMQRDLESKDSQLFATMEDLVDGWALDEEEAEAFREGFAFTFMLLSFESELLERDTDPETRDIELPKLSEPIAEGFLINLQMLPNEGGAYCQKAAEFLADHNYHLIDAWAEYRDFHAPGMTEEEKFTFLLGGVMAHDIIRDQVNATQIIEQYSASVN